MLTFRLKDTYLLFFKSTKESYKIYELIDDQNRSHFSYGPKHFSYGPKLGHAVDAVAIAGVAHGNSNNTVLRKATNLFEAKVELFEHLISDSTKFHISPPDRVEQYTQEVDEFFESCRKELPLLVNFIDNPHVKNAFEKVLTR